MVSYDYGQMPSVNLAYQQPYGTLLPPSTDKSIELSTQYSAMPPYSLSQALPSSQFSSMTIYPPNVNNNFLPHAPAQLPMQAMNYSMAPNEGTHACFYKSIFSSFFIGYTVLC
jgi:hypothetical protein